MRKLYLVPIIHSRPDMGSLAAAFSEKASARLGQELWGDHLRTVSGFWASVDRFSASLEVSGFKVYQDGLIADGAAGLRIIREGIGQGSENYRIIGKLLERGATLVNTEDLTLVRQEHTYFTKMVQSKSLKEKAAAALSYRRVQSRLLGQRDAFIARRIKETLGAGETGILFLGALHDILAQLPGDIRVIQVKDVAKVREYHRTLITTQKYSPRLHQLALYLISPISTASS